MIHVPSMAIGQTTTDYTKYLGDTRAPSGILRKQDRLGITSRSVASGVKPVEFQYEFNSKGERQAVDPRICWIDQAGNLHQDPCSSDYFRAFNGQAMPGQPHTGQDYQIEKTIVLSRIGNMIHSYDIVPQDATVTDGGAQSSYFGRAQELLDKNYKRLCVIEFFQGVFAGDDSSLINLASYTMRHRPAAMTNEMILEFNSQLDPLKELRAGDTLSKAGGTPFKVLAVSNTRAVIEVPLETADKEIDVMDKSISLPGGAMA